MINGKTIVICMPGNMYSGKFMTNFLELFMHIKARGGIPIVSQQYSSMVNFARCKVAGASVDRGKYQKPFGGQHYDYMLWIDSDIIFNTQAFDKLVSMDCDVASGWYSQPGGTTPVVEKMNDDYFRSNGTYEFITAEQMKQRKFAFRADYIGFGWVLVKRGVFERMEYPWFAPKLQDFGNGVQEMYSEDVAWCLDARAAGIDIYVDPQVRVGHEKLQII
jgi:GT2 family glycosyltransferase